MPLFPKRQVFMPGFLMGQFLRGIHCIMLEEKGEKGVVGVSVCVHTHKHTD